MSLSHFFAVASESGALTLASAVRINADHLRALKGPSQTMIVIERADVDVQDNKTRRILPGAARPAARLAWPAIHGRDALSGLPCVLVIQAGALRYEVEKLANVTRPELDAVDADGNTGALAFASFGAWVSKLAAEGAGLVVWFEGEAKTADGQAFPRYRLAVVQKGAEKVVDYRAAWYDDARATEDAAPPPVVVAELAAPESSEQMPF
jgi:hypothetical protein